MYIINFFSMFLTDEELEEKILCTNRNLTRLLQDNRGGYYIEAEDWQGRAGEERLMQSRSSNQADVYVY